MRLNKRIIRQISVLLVMWLMFFVKECRLQTRWLKGRRLDYSLASKFTISRIMNLKSEDKFLKKNWLTCSAGEVEGRTAPCCFQPNCLINWLSLLLSCSLATSHHSQCLFCSQIRTSSYIENVLAWHGHAWPFKRQPRIKKIGQSRMRRGFQDEGQSRLIYGI